MTVTQEEHISAGWTADDQSFGARLALIRQRMAWGNVKEAAVACGLPPESWRTWERDNVAPRRIVEVTAVIAERTGCDRIWLLTGERRSAAQPTRRYGGLPGRPMSNVTNTRPPDTRPPNGGPRPGGDRSSNSRTGRVPRHQTGHHPAV
jgi:hypothetical protein